MPAPDAADLELLERAVREAGGIAVRFLAEGFKTGRKPDGSPVTEADLAIDRALFARLRGARPDYGWLSEESAGEQARGKRLFIVDPIDGTVAFLKGKPHFTICAAVVENERPVAAAVFNPLTEECFTARTGAGAFCNNEPIHASARTALAGCRMLANRDLFALPVWTVPPNRPWPPMEIAGRNSIAYRLALVAKGEFDAMLKLSATHDWDLAAADLILGEAGGIVSGRDGAVLRYNRPGAIQPSVVGAGPALYRDIMARVKDAALS